MKRSCLQERGQAGAQGQGKQGQSWVPGEISSTSVLGAKLVTGIKDVADEVSVGGPWPLWHYWPLSETHIADHTRNWLLRASLCISEVHSATSTPFSFLPRSCPLRESPSHFDCMPAGANWHHSSPPTVPAAGCWIISFAQGWCSYRRQCDLA